MRCRRSASTPKRCWPASRRAERLLPHATDSHPPIPTGDLMISSIPRRTVIALAAGALLAAAVHAQSSGPIRVILPIGAGSGVDTIMRAAQNDLSKALGGQPVVIENLPGAGGITGTTA